MVKSFPGILELDFIKESTWLGLIALNWKLIIDGATRRECTINRDADGKSKPVKLLAK